MSGKRRVYEVARDMGMDNKAFVALLESLGVPEVKNHMSVMAPEAEERVRRHFQKANEPAADASSDARASGGVVKRRAGAVVRRKRSPDEEGGEHTDESSSGTSDDQGVGPIAGSASSGASPALSTEPSHEHTTEVVSEVLAPRETPVSPREEVGVSGEPAHAARASEGFVESSDDAPNPATSPASEPEVRGHSDEVVAVAAVPAPVVVPEIPPAPPVPDVTSPRAPIATPSARPPEAAVASSAPGGGTPSAVPPRPSQPPKRGIEVWEGRPGVPMTAPRPAAPRRVQYDPKAGMGPGGQRRGPGGPMMAGGPMSAGPVQSGPGGRNQFMRGKPRGIGSFGKARGAGAPVTKERAAHKKVVRIEESVQLQSLAASMGVKATDLLRKLFQLGMTGININSTLDADTAKIVGSEFGWDVEDVAVSEEEQLQKAQGLETEAEAEGMLPRPPVVTVMGHVDHGKTSLLDAIRKTSVVTGEAGGITQHIGAYSVPTSHGNVTFLDTPGHAAFAAMRARGAQATDLVVLVVAADDGVMPQTREAISHAKAAGVPIVVAVNKCDKPDAQPERVRRELADLGLIPEEWGGETLFVEVSAHTRKGVDELVERIALQAEVMELRANPDKPASGIVVESQLDRGRGPVATILVTEGTLRMGDVVLAGASFGKVRAMHDWDGRNLKEVGPSGPCAVVGLSEVPRAGDQVYVVKDLKTAQAIADTRKVKERRSLAPSAGNKPRTLEDIARLMSESEQLELKVIVKADVAGSAEAVADSLVQLSTEKVRVGVVLQAAGAITENDVNLAVAAGAIIVGFNAKPAGKAQAVAQREGVEIRQYSIIYNLLDDVRLAMEGLLAPKIVERETGKAEVRQTFRISKAGTVAGSMVIEGVLKRGGIARLFREGDQIWEGKFSGLKRFKEDVKEVKDGFECGISLDGMDEIHVGDIIVCFEVEHVKQSL